MVLLYYITNHRYRCLYDANISPVNRFPGNVTRPFGVFIEKCTSHIHIQWKIVSNLHVKIGSYFLVKKPKAVPSKHFTNVVMKKCDGSDYVCFSDARIKFETGWSVYLSVFWHKSIFKMLVDKIVNAVKSSKDDWYEILYNFL